MKTIVFLLWFLLGATSSSAQNKLLDSAKQIFRAQPKSALALLEKVKSASIKSKDQKSLIEALIIEGNIVYFDGRHDVALQIYLQGLSIAEANRLPEQIAAVCNEIGTLLKKSKQFEQALSYYERSLRESVRVNSSEQIANSHNNIGLIYEEQGKYSEALKQYQKSLAYYQKTNNKLGESYSLEYIGYVYGLMKNYSPAILNLEKCLQIRREIKDDFGIAICLVELTEVYRDQKDYLKAIAYAKQAVMFSKTIHYPDMLQQGYLLLAQLYEQQNDFVNAYKAHKQFVLVKDSVFNATKSKQIAELQTKYEVAQKEQKIKLLHQENIISKLKLTKREGLIVIIIATFLVFVLTVISVYSRYKLKQEAKLQQEVIRQQDLATRGIISAEENERKRIAGELHDGLGQMFSAVKLNLSALSEQLTFPDEHSQKMYGKTLSIVDESCREVRAISHQMAPNVLLKAGLTSAVRDFIGKIDSRKLKVNLSTSGLQERLEESIEIVLYRIIQEAVNNVIKHSKANSLDIQLNKEEDGITAMIEDNGIGFDPVGAEKTDGMGLKNIRMRAAYLRGTVDFSSIPHKGTLIAIYIPFKPHD